MSTYSYCLKFVNVKPKHKTLIKSIVDDFSWGPGLASAELNFVESRNSIEVEFTSEKEFVHEDEDKETENNLYHSLIGQGQLFSSLYGQLSEKDVARIGVAFVDQDSNEWNVELSKYSSLTKKP